MGPVAYFSLCLLGCLIFNPSLAGAQDMSCPEDWLLFKDNCYGFFPEGKTWIEAEAECKLHWPGAHLVSIHSAEESISVADYIKQYHTKTRPFWIGLSDPERNQVWTWSDESLVKFIAWEKGQPNSPRLNEHCAVLRDPEFLKWHDYPCEERFSFICKLKP